MGRLTGERRALAAAILAMYAFLYGVMGMLVPEDAAALFYSQTGVYSAAFLSLVAGYFWARWFVIGVGLSGFMMAATSLLQLWRMPDAPEPMVVQIFIFYAITHLAIAGLLWGNGMAKLFDGRPEWRKKFHLDESATNRLGKSVIRVGVSLPFVLMYAFAPREGAMLAILGSGAVVAGVWALTHMRTWALPALAVGVGTMLVGTIGQPMLIPMGEGLGMNLDLVASGAIGFTMLALAPFVGPVVSFLKEDD